MRKQEIEAYLRLFFRVHTAGLDFLAITELDGRTEFTCYSFLSLLLPANPEGMMSCIHSN